MEKQLEGIILENAKKYFKESGKYYIDENGGVDFEVYTDYSDTLADETVSKAFELFGNETEKIRDYLFEHIFECYSDYISDIEFDISNEVANYIENNVDSDTYSEIEKESLEVSDIREILINNNLLSVYVNYDDILRRSNLNLIISLENEVSIDHEFSLNNFNGNVLEWIEETENALNEGDLKREDISLITLLKSQGYTFEEFKYEATRYFNEGSYKPSSKFIGSLINECYNTTSMCNALVFLKQVNLLDYLNGDYSQEVKKGTPCGYVDFVYGGGATIDIVLEKDLSLSGVAHEIFPDGDKYGYSFKSIYGQFIR